MKYQLRHCPYTHKGVHIADIDPLTAGNMMQGARGEWKELPLKTGKQTCFVFNDDYSYEVGNRRTGESISLCIPKGGFLKPV